MESLLLYAEKLDDLMTNWENETVEFKEARGSYDTDKTGRYFSALSNEANLRSQQTGWLVFGVSETRERHLVGTNFKKGDRALLEKFKYEIARFSTGMIIQFLQQFGKGTRTQFRELLMDKLPDSLSDNQKESKIGNLLSSLRLKGKIKVGGRDGKHIIWVLDQE